MDTTFKTIEEFDDSIFSSPKFKQFKHEFDTFIDQAKPD
jgi:hypothetical protein